MPKKNDKKVPYLSAVLLALSVRRYVTKRINQRRGSRAIREATGRRLTRFHPVWISYLQGLDIFLRENSIVSVVP